MSYKASGLKAWAIQRVTAIYLAVFFVVLLGKSHRLANFTPFLHPEGWWKLLGTMGVIYVAFEGFEVILSE